MNTTIKAASVAALLLAGSLSHAGIINVSGMGTYQDSVEGDSGWLLEDTFGGVDFFTFEITSPVSLSLDISGDISFGFSLYQGLIEDDLLFENDADFSDLFGNDLGYLAGSDPFVPGSAGSLSDILLSDSGFYTIAVGGNEGFQDASTYNYSLNLSSAAVPEPAALLLLLTGSLGLFLRRKA